mgnify:CR=1 FL=1
MTKEKTHAIILKNKGCIKINCNKCYYNDNRFNIKNYRACKIYDNQNCSSAYHYILEQEKLNRLKEILS